MVITTHSNTMTSNYTCLTLAVSDLIIYKDIYFNLSLKTQLKKILDMAINMSKVYQPPNINPIYEDLLNVINDQNMERNLSLTNKSQIFLDYCF